MDCFSKSLSYTLSTLLSTQYKRDENLTNDINLYYSLQQRQQCPCHHARLLLHQPRRSKCRQHRNLSLNNPVHPMNLIVAHTLSSVSVVEGIEGVVLVCKYFVHIHIHTPYTFLFFLSGEIKVDYIVRRSD